MSIIDALRRSRQAHKKLSNLVVALENWKTAVIVAVFAEVGGCCDEEMGTRRTPEVALRNRNFTVCTNAIDESAKCQH